MGKTEKNVGVSVAGVALTHPSRLVFPELGITKEQLARYYEKSGKWILPHLEQRPLTIVRCPENWRQCFFQRHPLESNAERPVESASPQRENSANDHLMVDSLQSLVRFVQMGVLEFHTWGARADKLDRPDRMIFDLDPSPDLPWNRVVDAALLVKKILDEIGLASFVKTTGSKGFHVVVPLRRGRTWEEIKAFSSAVGSHLAALFPDRFTSKVVKEQRIGKVYVDVLRNAAEATAVAAFSTRALPGASISTPIAWDELARGVRSDAFTLLNIEGRLNRLEQDPWKDYAGVNQEITRKMMGMFG